MIKLFDDLNKNDADKAGGKGASLGEMTSAGINIPPGFVVLTEAFENHLLDNQIDDKIQLILANTNHQSNQELENSSAKIRNLIMHSTLHPELQKQIMTNFERLSASSVAVRSSATAEDSADAAWAGQLNSYLNTNKNQLITNIKECWASLYTSRAIFYSHEKGLQRKKISVAVVVQKMIQSDVSGVAFSVHPVTKNPDHLVIEACFGLGEAIVSGQVTPDYYVVNKKEGFIEEINIAEQSRAFVSQKSGGHEWVQLKNTYAQKISGSRILELAKLVCRIEDHYKFPCDIEWCMEHGKIYITQSRPITTL